MSYVGGKAKCRFIIDTLNHPAFDSMDYLEPCVGYGHILRRVVRKRSYTASDSHPLLMCLLQAIQERTPLPTEISRDRYNELRQSDEISVERGLAAFCYSFNGKCFAGYCPTYRRRNGRIDDMVKSRMNYYKSLQGSEAFQKATLGCCDFSCHTPSDKLVYADPPYRGTQGYGAPFDHERFWETMVEWSKGNIVLVSEYSAPADWMCIGQEAKKSTLAGGDKQTNRLEKLWIHSTALERVPFLGRNE
jgi:DNA adenine methylase